MGDILSRISSYNLFNYLFTGALFAVLANALWQYSLPQQSVVVELFMYYFTGLTVSRFGSIAIDPLFEKMKFIRREQYQDFVKASKNDGLVDTLAEVSNMYRTLTAGFFLSVLFQMALDIFTNKAINTTVYAVLPILVILFSLAYRKQIYYVSQRVRISVGS